MVIYCMCTASACLLACFVPGNPNNGHAGKSSGIREMSLKAERVNMHWQISHRGPVAPVNTTLWPLSTGHFSTCPSLPSHHRLLLLVTRVGGAVSCCVPDHCCTAKHWTRQSCSQASLSAIHSVWCMLSSWYPPALTHRHERATQRRRTEHKTAQYERYSLERQ